MDHPHNHSHIPPLPPPLRRHFLSTSRRAQQKVAELRGANQGGLRQAIQQQLALLGPSGGGGSGAGGLAMVNALASALARVKAECSYDEFVAAAKTLLVFVG